ncbi:MAG: 1-deoxy-D-xylulose-5-phosphate synthase, partial [Prevotella sp.]|nr:1-deoxy-D-xylulose-5-phosphate synthase [Prevotella sp.]
LLSEVATHFSHIVTIEDGIKAGGFGSAVLEWMNDNGYHPDIKRLGLPDNFVEHGTVAQLREIVGLDEKSIKRMLSVEC